MASSNDGGSFKISRLRRRTTSGVKLLFFIRKIICPHIIFLLRCYKLQKILESFDFSIYICGELNQSFYIFYGLENHFPAKGYIE
jgi:hypothetical protein